MITFLTLRFFYRNPSEGPVTRADQAILAWLIGGCIALDALTVVAVVQLPVHALMVLGAASGLWHIAGLFKSDDDERANGGTGA